MMAVSLLIVLVVSRVLASAGQQSSGGWWSPVAYLWHDAAVVLVFAAFESVLRRRTGLLWTAYAIAAVYAVINIPVQRALWSPLTWTMLRAAGGPLADSIRHYATWTNACAIGIGLAVAALAPVVVRRVPPRPVLIGALVCTVLGPAAAARVDTMGMERNAWSALAGGVPMRTVSAAGALDWRASHIARQPGDDLSRFRGTLAGRNVMLVSLESTAARYLGLYGAAADIAPNLSALARSAIVFENAYAVYPESIKGLFSILCSIAPGFDTTAESYSDVPCRSPAAILGQRGYRTALFHSGRFDYLGMNAVIRGRGYDVLEDAGDIGGRHESSFGIDEPSTVARVLQWIDEERTGRPFFVTYLPIAGHHPYESSARGPFPDDEEFGRYRNAVHDGDAALGALRRGLETRGLDRNTVWIILGDHGEAFGQHPGNYGHTLQLLRRDVRVPLPDCRARRFCGRGSCPPGRQPPRHGADDPRCARAADSARVPGRVDARSAAADGAVLHGLFAAPGRPARRPAQAHPRSPLGPVAVVRHRSRSGREDESVAALPGGEPPLRCCARAVGRT